MRLIDADALKKTFCAECDKSILCNDCDIDFHFERLAPTVDAIPIEWLKSWANNTVYERKTPNGEYRVIVYNDIIVKNIINDWKKERGDL